MSVTYTDYVNAIKSNVAQRILKINILDNNYNIVDSIEPKIIDGSINFSSDNGSRLSASLTFENSNLDFLPTPTSDLWMNSKYQIFTGYKVNDEDYYVSKGIFLMGEVEVNSDSGSDSTTTVNLYDLYTKLNGTLGGSLEDTYIIPTGSDVEDSLIALLTAAGETRQLICEPLNGETTSSIIMVEAGGNYSDIIDKFCSMTSRIFFYDDNGYPTFMTPPNDINNVFNKGSEWDFTTSELTYLGGNRKLEFSKVRNKVKVVGSNINGITYTGTASDTNVSSPTRIALIGTRTLVILDDVIYSNDLCQQRANYELQKSIQILEEVTVECIPIDILKGDSVITITNPNLGLTGDRFLVRSGSFPLLKGRMSMQVWMARSFQ